MPLSQSGNLTRGYFSLALAEGLGALLWLLLIPSDQAGLSAGRLVLMAPLLLLIAALAWLALSLWRRPTRVEHLAQRLYNLSCNVFNIGRFWHWLVLPWPVAPAS